MAVSTRNHEVISSQPLLDAKGNIAEAGWAPRQVWRYDRTAIKAPFFRIKEWDYYMVVGQGFAISLTLSDIGYMGLQSVSFFDLSKHPWVATNFVVNPLPRGTMGLPPDDGDHHVSFKSPRLFLDYEKRGDKRYLVCDFPHFYKGKHLFCSIVLSEPPQESVVVATPWDEPAHFYYNQKINCMRAGGFVTLGRERYTFNPQSDFATLDWGRGVWTYDNTWFWSSGNADIEGHPFGFNLGYGFANTEAASENVIFYDGRAHKIDDVEFIMRNPRDFEAPWRFTSSDGRFEGDFIPIIDRVGKIDVGFACTDQHQVFGKLSGTAVLDDGTNLSMNEICCFVERVRMKY